jgi:hypothetical protein
MKKMITIPSMDRLIVSGRIERDDEALISVSSTRDTLMKKNIPSMN